MMSSPYIWEYPVSFGSSRAISQLTIRWLDCPSSSLKMAFKSNQLKLEVDFMVKILFSAFCPIGKIHQNCESVKTIFIERIPKMLVRHCQLCDTIKISFFGHGLVSNLHRTNFSLAVLFHILGIWLQFCLKLFLLMRLCWPLKSHI